MAADAGCVTVTVVGGVGWSLLHDEITVAASPAATSEAAAFMEAG